MNKERRKLISSALTKIEEAKNILDNVLSDENDAFDSMPENLQYSTRGEESEEAIDVLDDSISSIEDVIDNLGNII